MCNLGKMACNIDIPSNGGMGIRLKNASETLTPIIVNNASAIPLLITPCKARILKAIPAIMASRIFVNIPAAATKANPALVPMLCSLYGTGLAQPKNVPAVKNASNGTSTEPITSIWGSGFRVRRPARLAVSSP